VNRVVEQHTKLHEQGGDFGPLLYFAQGLGRIRARAPVDWGCWPRGDARRQHRNSEKLVAADSKVRRSTKDSRRDSQVARSQDIQASSCSAFSGPAQTSPRPQRREWSLPTTFGFNAFARRASREPSPAAGPSAAGGVGSLRRGAPRAHRPYGRNRKEAREGTSRRAKLHGRGQGAWTGLSPGARLRLELVGLISGF